VIEVASGLDSAQPPGVVRRDLQLENITLSPAGHPG